MSFDVTHCMLCPRKCGADRTRTVGVCHCGAQVRVARAALHFWEEPCISGKEGSGTVFFSGCSLGCVFCQNREISRRAVGWILTVEQLADCFLHLQEQGARNINLVTGSHFTPWIAQALKQAKPFLHIPVVWNSSGYETLETLALLEGLVDLYLPDFKYLLPESAGKLSQAPDYPETAKAAILEMLRQAGPLQWDGDLLVRGTLIRHLVLPGHRRESLAILDWLAEQTPAACRLVSILGQYTPMPGVSALEPALRRRVATMEYDSVVQHAAELGLEGYCQDRSAAGQQYIPDFQSEGHLN